MLPIISGAGTLTREPEQRFTQSGTSIVSFGLAFNEKYNDASGQRKENVTFIDCTVFGALGEKVVMPYVHKGSRILILGKLKLDSWTAQDGSKRSKHSVTVENLQMLDTRADTQQNNQSSNSYGSNMQQEHNQPPQYNAPQPQESSVPEIDINSDEIPF